MKYMTITPHLLEYITSLEKQNQLQEQLIEAQDEQIKHLKEAEKKIKEAYDEMLEINSQLLKTNEELTEMIKEHVAETKTMELYDQEPGEDEGN